MRRRKRRRGTEESRERGVEGREEETEGETSPRGGRKAPIREGH